MNYPVWELYYLNSGTVVAIIAILHVFISHFAVGGGIFLWLTDLKSVRENNLPLREYVRRHLWFFLLVTMVFGGVSGVGIWFSIALSNPAATSLLIHTFVFAWAIEWVFFIVEIVSLLIYHYRFEVLSNKQRLTIAFIYALSAWLSLFVINGILTFMLTPGEWLNTRNFWDGFFNPTHLPGLFFRTSICIMFAGLFGFVTALYQKDEKLKVTLLRYCAKWLYIPLPFLFLSAVWYFSSLPESARFTNFVLNKQTQNPLNVFLFSSVLIYIVAILFVLKTNKIIQKVALIPLLLIGLFWIGSFEYLREYARKPYIIYGYMYSPSIIVTDAEKLNKEGFLKHAKWTKIKEISEENKIQAGRELFNLQCLSCHTIGGVKNDIIKKTEGLTYLGIVSQIYGQGKVLDYMPKFVGTEREIEALASFIVSLRGKKEEPHAEFTPKEEPVFIPSFDPKKDEYVLLVWSVLGEKCITDSDRWFSFLYAGSTLQALLIKRGVKPEIITEGVEIHYIPPRGHENPSKYLDFWKYSESLRGKKIPGNVGVSGKTVRGVFDFDKDRKIFIADAVPVSPYSDDGAFNPYPIFDAKAIEKSTGKVLQQTRFVVPVSTELRCFVCHGGKPRFNGISGISDETAINILKIHDRNHGTKLYENALKGKPMMCQKCHEDFIVKSEGIKGHNSFSASMHGWHANYVPYKDERACNFCHPNDAKGNTRCNRDIHTKLGIGCTRCHGKLDDHAASVLLAQKDSRTASILLKNLKPETPIEKINPRKPWVNQPDCLSCHIGFTKPSADANGFNKWTSDFGTLYRVRMDNTGKIPCTACHSSPHAVYPAFNDFGKNRDNIQPMQYQGNPFPIGADMKCEVCHKVKIQGTGHHADILKMFRNRKALQQ